MAGIATALITSGASAASLLTAQGRTAASVGWATQKGTTTGGKAATAANIYTAKNITEFKAALSAKTTAKIIQITGTIDISGGKAYSSYSDQKARSQILIPSNTTIIGIGTSGKFTKGSLVISNANNVIIRNVYVETPVDVAPHYESGDGWNAEWDSINVITSHHVWIDHVTFSDGSFTDNKYTKKNGETYVQHDGTLDIKRGSDYITVSNNRFEQHDKTILIGHCDTNGSQDAGKLHVTFYNNLFNQVRERAPRVRYGNVHAFNNVFVGNVNASTYAYLYSFGIGTSSSLLSESNAFNITNLKTKCAVVKAFNGKVFTDKNSLINNSAAGLSSCGFTNYTAKLPYSYKVQTMNKALVKTIMSGAGYGKI
ncbi:pectate lyase family protein [Lonsdalea iberica]|uniref:Pectate lyase n=1 Tax=Lonsdalea iberica TaxID=1082703 RepID=A0A1X3RNT9_9GAMM|nr:polysaccharide lyase [Lonsdalea iberica]OSN03421.1 pectate lyase [Lonsdalea iberica]